MLKLAKKCHFHVNFQKLREIAIFGVSQCGNIRILLSDAQTLTDFTHIPQPFRERPKLRILMKVGMVDQLIGKVGHMQYFCSGTTLMAVAAHPNFHFTK